MPLEGTIAEQIATQRYTEGTYGGIKMTKPCYTTGSTTVIEAIIRRPEGIGIQTK